MKIETNELTWSFISKPLVAHIFEKWFLRWAWKLIPPAFVLRGYKSNLKTEIMCFTILGLKKHFYLKLIKVHHTNENKQCAWHSFNYNPSQKTEFSFFSFLCFSNCLFLLFVLNSWGWIELVLIHYHNIKNTVINNTHVLFSLVFQQYSFPYSFPLR